MRCYLCSGSGFVAEWDHEENRTCHRCNGLGDDDQVIQVTATIDREAALNMVKQKRAEEWHKWGRTV